jgi:hypothetical protein
LLHGVTVSHRAMGAEVVQTFLNALGKRRRKERSECRAPTCGP